MKSWIVTGWLIVAFNALWLSANLIAGTGNALHILNVVGARVVSWQLGRMS